MNDLLFKVLWAILRFITDLLDVFCGDRCRRALDGFRFKMVRRSYEGRLAGILAGTIPPADDVAGIERGRFPRVAFRWNSDESGNWTGLVHDPTGEVRKAAEFKSDWSNLSDPRLAKVRKLFGGDLVSSRHLDGNWYLCSFV